MNLQNVIREQVLPAIPSGSKNIVLVDPPDHANIGDSAILKGEMTFLKTHFPTSKIRFVDYKTYAIGQRYLLEEADCILFHGGGNFGDLWKRHQNLRIQIMQEFPHKPMVQFPQSIHFKDTKNLANMAATIKNCEDYTLIVRDKNSLAYAKQHFDCPVNLSPDMAFYMPKMKRLKPRLDVFCLLREDKELLVDKTATITALLKEKSLTHQYEDWVIEKAPLKTKMNDLLCTWFRIYPSKSKYFQPIYEFIRMRYMDDNINRGIRLLSQGEVVLTDRLHAMIMSHLLGITNHTFDSLGGKVSSYYQAWLSGSELIHLTETVEDLEQQL